MIDTLPEDVITLILNHLETDNPLNESTNLSYLKMDINFVLSLRNINKYFKNYIEQKTNIWFEIVRDNHNGCFNMLITDK